MKINNVSTQVISSFSTPEKTENTEKYIPAYKGLDEIGVNKKWLILNFIAGDNNLSSLQVGNINDMEKVGSDENTHLVTFIDVGPEEKEDVPFTGARQYYIKKDDFPNVITSPMISNDGMGVDSGNYRTLRKFLIDVIKKFPSDNVALFLNSHGGGFTGAMTDDTESNFMSVPEIKKAIEDAQKETGKKLDILGFDACLMAELEVAYELKDCAKYYLASEENEGGNGWPYGSILTGKVLPGVISKFQKSLKSKIDVTPLDFAKGIVKACAGVSGIIPTFSAVDLSKMTGLSDAVNEFAKALIKTNDKKSMKDSINRAENYGRGKRPYSDLHDLGHIAENMTDGTAGSVLKDAALKVSKEIENAVIANEVNPKLHPNSHGISIYAPLLKYNYDDEPSYKELSFTKDKDWHEALEVILT